MNIGLLHPGAMGVSVGAALMAAGQQVFWLPAGRSDETLERARSAGFDACDSLSDMSNLVEGIVSVCPPEAALELATEVVTTGFEGIYLDANAVSPDTAREMAARVGDRFVDGGIVGLPATSAGTTRLYLSGELADTVAEWFSGGLLGVESVDGPAGSASALKMCYAAYTKGSSALLLAIRALAEAEGVTEALLHEWYISQKDLPLRSEYAARGTAPKAWRFVAEMREIAATFEARQLPGGFHLAAAEVYSRMSDLKHVEAPTLDDVLKAIQDG